MVHGEILQKVPRRPTRQGTVATAGTNWRVCKEGVKQDRHTSFVDTTKLPQLPKGKDRRRSSISDEETDFSLKDVAQASMEDLKKAIGRPSQDGNGPTIASVFMAAFWEKRRMNKRSLDVEVVAELNKWLEEHGAMIDVYRGALQCNRHVFEDHHTSKKLPKLIFHPFHPYRLMWDVLIMVMLLYSLVSVPYVVAFVSATGCQGNFFKQTKMWYFDFCLDVIFMTDILVNFRTAYFNHKQQGKLVTHWTSIAANYMKGFFWIDLVSSMPYDVILLFACDSEDSRGASFSRAPRIIRVIRVVRVLRLLRVSRISKFLQKLRDLLRLNPGVVRLIEFVALILFVMHYNSCIFFFLGEFFLSDQIDLDDPGQASWTTSNTVQDSRGQNLVHHLAPWEQYVVSLYWAVTTMTTMGYGDITPVTTVEVAFTILVILQGGITFSYIVGNMANLLSRINLRQLRYRESMEQWEDFMYREHLPTELSQRIKNLKRHLYLNPSRHIPPFAAQELSSTLLRDITAHIFRPLLSRLPTFQALDECSLTALSLALEPLQIAPQQVLYREGESADCMYFFHAGEIQMSMLLMTEEAKTQVGAKVIADPKVADWFEVVDDRDGRRKLNACLAEGTVLWQGLQSRRHKFFRWNVTPKRKAYFGESVLSAASPARLATVVTKSWCSIFRLKVDALHHLSSRFPALGEVVKALRGNARQTRLRQMASKIIRAMRMKEQSQASLLVVVETGASLPPSDYRLSRCDPYCTVQLQPALGAEGVNRTLIQFNTSFPVWNEQFPYTVPPDATLHQRKLMLKVYDHDATGAIDQFGLLGEGEVDLSSLARRLESAGPGELVQQSQWVPLWRKRRRSGNQWKRLKGRDGRGAKVHVVVKWVPATGAAKHLQVEGDLVGDGGPPTPKPAAEASRGRSGFGLGSMLPGRSGRAMSVLKGVLPGTGSLRVPGPTRTMGGNLVSGKLGQPGPAQRADSEGSGGGVTVSDGGAGVGAWGNGNGRGRGSRDEGLDVIEEDGGEPGEAARTASALSGSSVASVSRLVSGNLDERRAWDDVDSRVLDSGELDSRFYSSTLDSKLSSAERQARVAAMAEEAKRAEEDAGALHAKVARVLEMLAELEQRGALAAPRTPSAKGKGILRWGDVDRAGIRVFGAGKKELLPLPPLPRQNTLPRSGRSFSPLAAAHARSASSSPTHRQRGRLKQMPSIGSDAESAAGSSERRAADLPRETGDTVKSRSAEGLREEVRAYLEELARETDVGRLDEHLRKVRLLRQDLGTSALARSGRSESPATEA